LDGMLQAGAGHRG